MSHRRIPARSPNHFDAAAPSVDVNGWTEAASDLRIRILKTYERTPEVERALQYEAWRLEVVRAGLLA
jgi:hypothetical protein